MAEKYTVEQLNKLNKKDLMLLVLSMQDQLTQMNDNLEKLIEQIRIANQQRFGRHTETLDAVSGQLSLFNEAEALAEDTTEELTIEEVLATIPKQKKQRGKRDADLSGFQEEKILHSVSQEELNEMYGDGSHKRMPDESYKRLRYEPASWTVEVHTVGVYVGTDGLHQDEFVRGDRPKDLLRNSIVTPSLETAIINRKYVNSIPLYRIEQEFQRGGVHISRQLDHPVRAEILSASL
ncbi:transposase [[Clostridium] scindens]|nr:transposase [[Clostridium] scindens]MCB6284484.1 transposase [[Clostridium] scindens]MCB6423077.1 transposase [[Clostridium] scindens]MCB7191030.1 transposase [[Clostridium] scindens]MCB7287942.1 transposase [[Clostridium] scindens]MCG4927465.1 transposase [[Clostridium] scindens]